MPNLNDPLFTLSIQEFKTLLKEIMEEAFRIMDKQAVSDKEQDDVCDIAELCTFLHCSKPSIHNYKKIGMPYYRVGRKLLFKKSEVLKFRGNNRNPRKIQRVN
jgi:hypothetical protein